MMACIVTRNSYHVVQSADVVRPGMLGMLRLREAGGSLQACRSAGTQVVFVCFPHFRMHTPSHGSAQTRLRMHASPLLAPLHLAPFPFNHMEDDTPDPWEDDAKFVEGACKRAEEACDAADGSLGAYSGNDAEFRAMSTLGHVECHHCRRIAAARARFCDGCGRRLADMVSQLDAGPLARALHEHDVQRRAGGRIVSTPVSQSRTPTTQQRPTSAPQASQPTSAKSAMPARQPLPRTAPRARASPSRPSLPPSRSAPQLGATKAKLGANKEGATEAPYPSMLEPQRRPAPIIPRLANHHKPVRRTIIGSRAWLIDNRRWPGWPNKKFYLSGKAAPWPLDDAKLALTSPLVTGTPLMVPLPMTEAEIEAASCAVVPEAAALLIRQAR